MSNYRTLLRSIFSSQLSAAVLTLSSLAVLIVLTRSTEVAVFGQYSVVIGTVAMFTKFAGLNAYFFYRNRYPLVSYDDALGILRQYLPFVGLCGLSVALAVAMVNIFVSPFLPLPTALDYALWAALVVLSLLNFELVRFYQSIGRNVFSLWLSTATKLGCLALLGAAVLPFGAGLDLRAIVIILIGAQIIAALFQVLSDRRFVRIINVAAPRFDWRAVSAGIFVMPTALFYDALTLFDRLALAKFMDYETAGHYSLASQGILIAYSILGGTLITLFYPKLVKARNSGTIEETRRMVRLVFMAGGGACLAGAVGILAFSGLIPLVFEARYSESVGIIRMMCLVPLALFLLSALAHLAYLFDDLKWSVASFSIGIVECVALNYLLISRWGVQGAISALYISLLTMMVLHVAILMRKSSQVRREQII